MNKMKALLVAGALAISMIIASIFILYMEYNRLIIYRTMVTEIGHEVINIRDTVTQHALEPDTDPYYLTQVLVEIERNIQEELASYAQSNYIGIYEIEAFAQLGQFTQALSNITDTLDHVIGIIIMEKSLIQAIYKQFKITPVSSSSALRLAFLDDQSLFSKMVSEAENPAVTTFLQVEKQKKQLLSILLSHENMDFIERSEVVFGTLSEQVRTRMVQLLIVLFLIIISGVCVAAWLRMKELHRNNVIRQEAMDRIERANQAKSIFLATMSHELRTPMNGVLGIAQMIEEDAQEAHIREQAKVIVDSGQHLVTLLNDILDFSKIEQGKMVLEYHKFSVCEVIAHLENALMPLAKNKAIQFHVQNEVPSHCHFIGDSARVRQILFNLAGNAIKFTQEGYVDVHFALLHDPRRVLEIKVSDSGIGIARDKLEGIFTPFEQADLSTTRKFGGTGLGLSIVKQMTDLMGGSIHVFSQLGVGTQFVLQLPLAIEEESSQQNQNQSQSQNPQQQIGQISLPSGHGEKDKNEQALQVLLVDDNRVNALVAQQILHKCGHQVQIASDGLEALDILKQRSFDLIIMDNHMPNLSGIETIQQIRQQLKLSTVIFAYTADVFKEAHDAFIAAGAQYVLTKPLQKNSLEQAICRYQHEICEKNAAQTEQNVRTSAPVKGGNVIYLVRAPVTQLPITEEELSTCAWLQHPQQSDEEKRAFLTSFAQQFDAMIDALIATYASGDLPALSQQLDAIDELAAQCPLAEVLNLVHQSQALITQHCSPDLELLQQLINRMLVNLHQANRLLHASNDKARQEAAL
ncbi:Sensor histidine kinase RcsC [Vibrio stylophorae]|uniref:histidine kinase n=1 Tax=Vibrio stylophorae TaxID=659351 RepID=A0ABN8DSB3_9VIBR|nr:ATP-binding protein [Vibrio stylophorae]CAH0533223.1 Sensor histidine kinase RcsC [Vibrio stylophorae]